MLKVERVRIYSGAPKLYKRWFYGMAISEAKKRANKKWNDENLKKLYDRIALTVPKGKKESIKAHAELQGESLNGFINRAIDDTIKKDQE
jgi:predicted HicB family RNase H-like nuclease